MIPSGMDRQYNRQYNKQYNRQYNRQLNNKIYVETENKYMLKKNMGPMGPRGLGPWALWAPGALGPNYGHFEKFQNLPKVAPKDL